MAEWESISKAVEELGVSREDIMYRIHSGKLPFRKNGTRYTVNIKLARAVLCREDMNNMKTVQNAVNHEPLSIHKVTKDINNKERPKRKSKVRRVMA